MSKIYQTPATPGIPRIYDTVAALTWDEIPGDFDEVPGDFDETGDQEE